MNGSTPLEQRQDQLQARLAALDQELSRLAEAAEGSNGDDEHDPEGHTLAYERMQVIALRHAAAEALEQVRAARSRPPCTTCARCGDPIGSERLVARPTTTLCVRCAGRR